MADNQIYRFNMPKGLAVLWHISLMVPMMMAGSVYAVSTEDIVGSMQIWSEDFMFISLSALVGFAAVSAQWHRIVCVRRHRAVWLAGLSVMMMLTFLSMHTRNVWLLAFYNVIIGGTRMTMHITNISALARKVKGLELRIFLGPKGDGTSTATWDANSAFKATFIPLILALIMSIVQVAQWLLALFAATHPWQQLYPLTIAIFAAAMLLLVVIEKHRDWSDPDESASPLDDAPSTPDGRCPYLSLKFLGSLTATCITWEAFIFFFIYGKTLDWFHSQSIVLAAVLFVVFFALNIIIDNGKPDSERYFRRETLRYPSLWLSAVLLVIAMTLNSSSALTNIVAAIGLSMDTYVSNMLSNWNIAGYLLGGITCVVMRRLGIHFRWTTAFCLLAYAWLMWFTYNQVQMQARYDDLRMLTIVRSALMVLLSANLIGYALWRMPLRLFPSWIHIVMVTRAVMASAIGYAYFGAGLQHYQREFTYSLAAATSSPLTVTLQSIILSVKHLSGQLLWFCLILTVIVILIPWPQRQLKPEEIPDETSVSDLDRIGS